MVPQSSGGKLIQLSVLNIRFELQVPGIGVKLHKPVSKRSQLLRIELFHLPFEVFDSAHIALSPAYSKRRN